MATFIVKEEIALDVRPTWCGHYVALPPSRWQHLRETGETFWCPYGHQAVFQVTEVTRLTLELAQAQEVANFARQSEKTALLMLEAEQKVKQRLLRRIKAGICPHCHRTFQQLARHMESKHREQP